MGGAGGGVDGAWGGARECFSAAGGTSSGDDRPVNGASEPVSPAGEASVSVGHSGAHPRRLLCSGSLADHTLAVWPPGCRVAGSAEALTLQVPPLPAALHRLP